MIIEFSISNYGSFNKIQTLSFKGTNLDSGDRSIDLQNLIFNDFAKYLKIIGLYGANASGKTNLLKALLFFKDMISFSVVSEDYSRNNVNPFRQSAAGLQSDSFFQVIILLDNKKYRYGFTIKTNGEIGSEWLFGPAEKNETYYFKRISGNVQINSEWFDEGMSLPLDNLRTDALFLSFCSSYNGQTSRKIRRFFWNDITFDLKVSRRGLRVGGISPDGIYGSTNRLIDDGNEEMILTWLREVGLVYNSISIPNKEERTYSMPILLSKNIYSEDGKVIGQAKMDLKTDESEGTRKFYSYIGKFYKKFQEGGVYIVDEIDSNFHPSLLQKIVQLFQNPNINKANAQLLFTSHDTNLMDPKIMRRDQFYFAEKNIYDATKLYSLADLKGIRNNADFARQYLAGIYGALPVLGDFLENKIEEDSENIKREEF